MIELPKKLNIPDWANWVAQDRNGAWWAFEHEPTIDEESGIWLPEETIKRTKWSKIEILVNKWKNTKTKIERGGNNEDRT